LRPHFGQSVTDFIPHCLLRQSVQTARHNVVFLAIDVAFSVLADWHAV
jgi:hypothetical protein